MWLALLSLVAGAAWAEPALVAGQADGKPLVRVVAAKLAAWRPTEDSLAVVVPGESGDVEIEKLPNGMSAEKISQNGMAGVLLKGRSGSWQVVQDGANWLVRPGTGTAGRSILMLKDGWRLDGIALQPKPLTVGGKTWDVALVNRDVSVAGSVVGAVRTARAGLPFEVAKEVVPAPVEVIAKAVPEAPKKDSLAALPSLKPVALPDVMESELKPLPVVASRAVKLALAPSEQDLRRYADVEPAAGHEMMGGRVDSGEAPVSLSAKETIAALQTAQGQGLTKVSLQAAPSMTAMPLGGPASEVLPQVLGEIYLPGTVVSLTLPDMHGGLSQHIADEPVVAIDVSATISETLASAQVSRTWNQTTLEPIVAAREASGSHAPSGEMHEDIVQEEHPVVRDEPEVAVSRLFPNREDHYFDQLTDALQSVAVAPEGSTRARDAQMGLAQVYLIWQRPEEALGVLATLPRRADGKPASPQARLLMAVAQMAKRMPPPEKDLNALLDLGGPLGGHGKLWKAVAASQRGDYAMALKTWPEERGILPQYPAYLRSMAQFAQANALVMVGDRASARQVVDELVKGYDNSDVPVGLVRLQGLVRLGTNEESEGMEFLAKAAEDMRDRSEAYRAKYQFVQALSQRKDLSDPQVLQYLSDLWFDWRGDDLERDVLNSLAEMYEKQGEPREALKHWQVLVKAFPDSTDMRTVTERMTEAFLDVFDPENPKVYDLLAYVGLYYDFSELVPNDARGDVVQEQVARMLVNANLWDRAVPILEQQLQYRPLDPATQGRLALLLAESYGSTGNAAEGLKTLDKWQKVATTTVLARSWKVQEAKLLLLLNRPESATKALAALPQDDVEARDLRVEAAWAAKNWAGSVPLLQEKLAQVPGSQLISDTGAQLATFRLAYAYGQLKDGNGVEAVSQRYSSSLAKLPQLSDDIGAVAAGTGVSASVVAAGPLAPLTGALNDLNRMTDRVQLVRDSITGERRQQKEYNDKMRYMELLPPPTI